MNEEEILIWNEEVQDWGYWKDGVFYEQPQYTDMIDHYLLIEFSHYDKEANE